MASNAMFQYTPCSTSETSANAALSVRFVRDNTNNINNWVHFVGNNKVIAQPCIPEWTSWSGSTAENVVKIWAPRLVPGGYTKYTWALGHYRMSGGGEITWRLYSSGGGPYRGPSVGFDTNHLTTGYSVATITSSVGNHQFSTDQSLAVRRQNGYATFVLTAEAGASTQGAVTSIDLWPHETDYLLTQVVD